MKNIKFELYGKVTHVMTLDLLRTVWGRAHVAYTFGPTDDPNLFANNDFTLSFNNNVESDDTAIALLGFLTLASGDTDPDFFKNYTKAQLAFANGIKDSDLSMLVYDWEDGNIDNIYVDYDDNGDITIAVCNPLVDPIICDQCNPCMINGVFCHETGCINANKSMEDILDDLDYDYDFFDDYREYSE